MGEHWQSGECLILGSDQFLEHAVSIQPMLTALIILNEE
jgi:hypothetical protein